MAATLVVDGDCRIKGKISKATTGQLKIRRGLAELAEKQANSTLPTRVRKESGGQKKPEKKILH